MNHRGLDSNGTTVILLHQRDHGDPPCIEFPLMEGINLTLKDLVSPPPVMPWREFANWIRMSEDHDTVWGWIRNGYIPSHKVGKHVMVNVALLTQHLMEKEFMA